MQSMYNSADCEAQLYVGLNLIQVQLEFRIVKTKFILKHYQLSCWIDMIPDKKRKCSVKNLFIISMLWVCF